jgi:uncharacterized membrane protein YkvA (DUF1232 family)
MIKLLIWNKLKSNLLNLGTQFLYSVLLLFYSYKRKDTPNWAKRMIIGVLGYFLAPIDSIPDLAPLIGYTDDLGVISFGLVAIASYVNDDVRLKARKTLKKWTGTLDFEVLKAVDKKL